MSIRDLFKAAAAHGMKVQMHPKNPEVCAIVCMTCGYGDGWLDQCVKGYTAEPYDCPRCTLPADAPHATKPAEIRGATRT